jgi:prepilin-type N-terminal cleavage/methylation domain-containing protein
MAITIKKSRIESRVKNDAGFSLVELMVAVTVMGIVTSQLLLSFSHQHRTSLEQERTVEIQQEARLINDLILSDLRIGGFMVPAFASVGSLDGGVNGSDILCVSDSTIINDNVLAGATNKFPGATITAAIAGGASAVTVSAGTMDIDSDGDDDFVVNDGLLIGTGTEAHCAVITGIDIAGSTISFTPSTVAGFSAASDDVAVPALVYQVNGTTISRNSMILSNHIEDLQVQFGVDADRNGTVEGAEFPIDDLSGEEFELIENVRITLTARDQRGKPGFAGQFASVANRVAGAADNFKRRRMTGDTVIRNLQ